MQKQVNEKFSVADILALFKNKPDPETKIKWLLITVGVALSPITLLGVLWFYIRSYNRNMKPQGLPPLLAPLLPITKIAMLIGGFSVWAIILGTLKLIYVIFGRNAFDLGFLTGYFGMSTVITFTMMTLFNKWRDLHFKMRQEEKRLGSAKFGEPEEYKDLQKTEGIYIGGGYVYTKQGHFISIAGARGGKGTNLIIPNLLGASNYKGSWVIIDPKGENAAVTAYYQREIGQKVIILNPWAILGQSGHTYNPLDLIDIKNPDSLIDDSTVLAQMIVPDNASDHDPYWRNRARSLITGMIIHLMLSKEEKTITKIWEWLRLPEEKFAELVVDMATSLNAVVRGVANELGSIKESEKAYASILSSAQEATDFLKSPALQASLKTSNFNINELSQGNTTLYIVIPADKLDSQSQWLRMVLATALMSVVRNPNERVTFLMDEAASLGKMPILETYMGLAAGYNLSLWPIFQNIGQIKRIYGAGWETFIGNAAVRHYFSINDNETARYVSESFGNTTFVTEIKDGKSDATGRALITPGEVKNASADNIFVNIEQRNPYYFAKAPYHDNKVLNSRAKPNPYFKG